MREDRALRETALVIDDDGAFRRVWSELLSSSGAMPEQKIAATGGHRSRAAPLLGVSRHGLLNKHALTACADHPRTPPAE